MYVLETMDFRLHADRTMIVAGPSQCGKTTFLLQLLSMKDEIFRSPIKRIIWAYGQYQHELHQSLKEKGYILHLGIPTASDLQPHDLLIMDDLLGPSQNNKEMTTMFTQTAHHLPCFVIFVSQNIFTGGKESRTRSLNMHYCIIFKNPRDKSQIQFLARQMYPGHSKSVTQVFSDATNRPHGYLFIDFTQECPDEYRLRTHILDIPMTVYKLI